MSEPDAAQRLLVAIVHHDDADRVSDALREAGLRSTRIPSFGGFLGEPNETYLIAVERERVSVALDALASVSQTRQVDVPLVLLGRLSDWKAKSVSYGGATVLIVDLEGIVRL
jgi:uncharacterized protein YaaQ